MWLSLTQKSVLGKGHWAEQSGFHQQFAHCCYSSSGLVLAKALDNTSERRKKKEHIGLLNKQKILDHVLRHLGHRVFTKVKEVECVCCRGSLPGSSHAIYPVSTHHLKGSPLRFFHLGSHGHVMSTYVMGGDDRFSVLQRSDLLKAIHILRSSEPKHLVRDSLTAPECMPLGAWEGIFNSSEPQKEEGMRLRTISI